METINNKTFSHRPIDELFAIVRNDFTKYDDEGLIDDGTLVKVVKYCNDRLGIGIREVRQACIPVEDYKAQLPKDFEKLYYVFALKATNSISFTMTNPFNNSFDRDIIYDAKIDRDSFGDTEHYSVTIDRKDKITVHTMGEWIPLSVAKSSVSCHMACPNTRKQGKYAVQIEGDMIHTPFRSGELYIMYIATMRDAEGRLLFPFHPMITPYYEWSLKEKIVMDALFNSEISSGDLLALAQREKGKAWLDAYDMTTSKAFGEYVAMQRTKELGWYNQYFKFFQ